MSYNTNMRLELEDMERGLKDKSREELMQIIITERILTRVMINADKFNDETEKLFEYALMNVCNNDKELYNATMNKYCKELYGVMYTE